MAYCKCGNNAFQVSKQNVQFDEKRYVEVKFIVCSNPECQLIIGTLPDRIKKINANKIPNQSKPAATTKVVNKTNGAMMTGLELAKKNIISKVTAKPIKGNSISPDLSNTNLASQTTTVSSVTPNIANANAETTTSTISERKTRKAKK